MFGFLMLTINRYTSFGPFLWILRFHKSMLVQFGGFKLMRKFHLLKERVTEWNKEVFWGLGNRKGSGGDR